MKEKILALLKQRIPGASNTFLDGVADNLSKTITEESQIETVITDGVIESLKFSSTLLQTEGDRRANEATVNAVKNYEQKHNLKNGKPAESGGDDDDDDEGKGGDQKAIKAMLANAVKEAIEPIKTELEGYRKAASQKENTQKLVDKLKGEGITEKEISAFNLLAGVSVEKPEDIDSTAATIKEKYTEQRQILVDSGQLADTPMSGSQEPGKMSAKDYQKIMEEDDGGDPGKVDLGVKTQ